jgi:hypothetical protein
MMRDTSDPPPDPGADAPDPLAHARALLAADGEERGGACQEAIGQALARWRCRLEARPAPGPGPGLWAWAIVVAPESG